MAFPEPDFANCGGISVFMKVGHLAEAYNLPLTSQAYTTGRYICWPQFRSEAEGIGHDRYIAEPLVIRDGNGVALERAGHGVSSDWASLEKLRS